MPFAFLVLLAGLVAGCTPSGSAGPQPGDPTTEQRYAAVALSCEYAECPVGVVKPAGDVRVEVVGSITGPQQEALTSTIEQWNTACGNHTLTTSGSAEAKMEFFFVPESRMSEVMPIYVEGNVGLFTYDWDASNVITGMKVAIAADLSGDELVHFVLEETTQAMGLINDVEDPRSIFDGGTGRATAYSSLDREVIELHCSTSVKPGMQASDIS